MTVYTIVGCELCTGSIYTNYKMPLIKSSLLKNYQIMLQNFDVRLEKSRL